MIIRTGILVVLFASSVYAQTQNVEVEPVTCWWRTTTTAVRVGENFDVVLTCSLLQTEAARVIADESRLEPSVVQLQPFEVVRGSRAKDLTTATRRFIQYTYQLHVLAENVFASEAALPPVEIAYRVESRVGSGDSVQGRDLAYALPSLAVRVLSLVPDTADDIREAPVSTFGDIEGLGSRGTMLRVLAISALGVGALLLVLALVRAVRVRRAARKPSERTLAAATVLRGVQRELSSVQEQVRSSGWTADLAGRALAALRVLAAYATGKAVTQSAVGTPTEGQLLISGRMSAPAVVSASVATTDDDELRDALSRFTSARYGREAKFDGRLDDAIDAAMRRADRLMADRPMVERLWPR